MKINKKYSHVTFLLYYSLKKNKCSNIVKKIKTIYYYILYIYINYMYNYIYN